MFRNRSEAFPLWLFAGGFALLFFFKNLFEGLFYSWVIKQLERYLGVMESEVAAKFAEISISLIGAIATVWLLYRYIESNLRRELASQRELQDQSDRFAHTLKVTALVRNDPIKDEPRTLEWVLVVRSAAQAPIHYRPIGILAELDGADPVRSIGNDRILTVGDQVTYQFPFQSPYDGREGLMIISVSVEYGAAGRPPCRRLIQRIRVPFQPRGVVTHSTCQTELYEETPL